MGDDQQHHLIFQGRTRFRLTEFLDGAQKQQVIETIDLRARLDLVKEQQRVGAGLVARGYRRATFRSMAHAIRIEFSGALYHVTSRGDRGEAIYEEDADRAHFLEVLGQVGAEFNWICHAYCLMTNHYHLVIETPHGNLSRGMRQLNGVSTQYSNRRHGRTRHLLQGRF